MTLKTKGYGSLIRKRLCYLIETSAEPLIIVAEDIMSLDQYGRKFGPKPIALKKRILKANNKKLHRMQLRSRAPK